MKYELIKTEDYLFVVSNVEIKKGDFPKYSCLQGVEPLVDILKKHHKPILYDGYLGRKIIAHLPLKNAEPLESIDLLPPFKEDVYLNKSKIPIAFECDMERFYIYKNKEYIEKKVPKNAIDKLLKTISKPKKITNSENKTEWIGKYIFN